MAKKDDILLRRQYLKKIMVDNRANPLKFKEIFNLCRETDFIEKFGYTSESRIRDDLKSIGIYPSKDNTYCIDSGYDINSVEMSIIRAMSFFTLYRPMTIGYPAFEYENDDIGEEVTLYGILLKYNPSAIKSNSKYNIDYLIKKLKKYYEHTIETDEFGYLDICINENSIQFLFIDEEKLDSFYLNLVDWKRKSNSPIIRKALRL